MGEINNTQINTQLQTMMHAVKETRREWWCQTPRASSGMTQAPTYKTCPELSREEEQLKVFQDSWEFPVPQKAHMAKAEHGKGQHGGNRVGEGLGPDLLGLINLSFLEVGTNKSFERHWARECDVSKSPLPNCFCKEAFAVSHVIAMVLFILTFWEGRTADGR